MVIITGTSRGIGKALAENYLSKGEKVIGIGRNHTISHPDYEAMHCDLKDPGSVSRFSFPDLPEEPIVFIHNAGILGEINYFERLSPNELAEVMQVNLFAGAGLLQKLLQQIPPDRPFTAVFISSGAGKKPMASWASYCASKAAVDLFCQTIQLEEQQLNRTHFKCLSVEPGVVDTDMQAKIRTSTKDSFPEIERFKAYKDSGQLYSPGVVAQKLYKLLHNTPIDRVLYSLRDIDL